MWVIIYGDLDNGIRGVIGPFSTEDEAIEYGESHNLGHYEKSPYEVEAPQ